MRSRATYIAGTAVSSCRDMRDRPGVVAAEAEAKFPKRDASLGTYNEQVRIQPPEESLERLWRDHSVELRRLAFVLVGDREEADQLVQDAFVLAWERWDRVGALEAPARGSAGPS
jgi:hypothetical protein